MHLGSDWFAACRLWFAHLRQRNARRGKSVASPAVVLGPSGGSGSRVLIGSSVLLPERARSARRPTPSTSRPGTIWTWTHVLARIDRTHSSVGQVVLHRLLRSPTRDPKLLTERHRVIELLRVDTPSERRCSSSSRGSERPVTWVRWCRCCGTRKQPKSGFPRSTALALLALPALLAPFYVGAAGLRILTSVFSANYVVHYRTRVRFEPEIQALGYLGNIAGDRPPYRGANAPGLAAHRDRLRDAGRSAGPIVWRTALLPSGAPTDLLLEYLNILFLIEARGLAKTLREVAARRPALREAFVAVGELDAIQAAASFREGLP